MNDLSVTIFRPADDYEFTSKAALAAHYAAVKRRLSARAYVPPVKLVQPAPIPAPMVEKPPVHIPRPWTSVCKAILTLQDEQGPLTLEAILRAIAKVTDTPYIEIVSERRFTKVAKLRFTYFYLAREHTVKTFGTIGKACGNRDYTTALYGANLVKRNLLTYKPMIDLVRRELNLMGAT